MATYKYWPTVVLVIIALISAIFSPTVGAQSPLVPFKHHGLAKTGFHNDYYLADSKDSIVTLSSSAYWDASYREGDVRLRAWANSAAVEKTLLPDALVFPTKVEFTLYPFRG
jgi:hypothetical protein